MEGFDPEKSCGKSFACFYSLHGDCPGDRLGPMVETNPTILVCECNCHPEEQRIALRKSLAAHPSQPVYREVLGVDIGDSEDETFWSRSLLTRTKSSASLAFDLWYRVIRGSDVRVQD